MSETRLLAPRLALLAAYVMSLPAAAQAQTYSVVAHLSAYPGPNGGVVQGLDGELYSTTAGGEHAAGSAFKVSTQGTLLYLHKLIGESHAGLLLATDGNYYGTTEEGGTRTTGGPTKAGSIFRLTPSGKLTTLYSFCAQKGCADSWLPKDPLIQAADGNLYGTTSQGGACPQSTGGCGTAFKMTLSGKLSILYQFCAQPDCEDGGAPQGGLIQASDGNFYGTTAGGGTAGYGTVFRLTPAGVLTTLYSFCKQTGCPDGSGPAATVVQASDGNLYGTTPDFDGGTVFQVTLDGAFQTLYHFCAQPDCADGLFPVAPLIQATDGNLYGTTSERGAYGEGTIFSITPAGALVTVYNFCAAAHCSDGAQPFGPLYQATDGDLYGTTSGSPGSTVYRLSTGLAPFVIPLPISAKVRGRVTILGMNLTGATAVTFNGVAATSFRINSTGSAITTAVPAGATTGPIQVTLADGSTLASNLPFQVRRR